MSSASDCVLLHGDALRGSFRYWNATKASATDSGGRLIRVCLSCPLRPLLPTILLASVDDEDDDDDDDDFTVDPPCIVRAVEDLILLRVPLDRSEDQYDLFVYRPGGEKGRPSLKLIPPPKLFPPDPTFFHDEDVGLLRRGEDHYTIAALVVSDNSGMYDLHRFDSVTEVWSVVKVPLVEPQVSFPCKKIPRNSERLLFHVTSTVIPIGGNGGTMGWVDLWSGILLCDVLSAEPKLRGVPLPLPLDWLSCNNGLGVHLGCPKSLRGITFMDKPGMEPHLKFVELTVDAVRITEDDSDEEAEEEWKMHDWTITTWSNYKMTASWEDWHMDCRINASGTAISSNLKSKMLKNGLLSPGGARAFQNLLVFFPALGIDEGVVYLQARVKFMDPKVFVLALDTRDNKLLGAVEFATERIRGADVAYFPSVISKYIDPRERTLPIPDGGDTNLEESIIYEGTDYIRFSGGVAWALQRSLRSCLVKLSLNDSAVAT